jgi:type IV secretory pathway VirB4 component
MLNALKSRDERMEELEKRLDEMERNFNKKLKQVSDSFSVMINVINKMEHENKELKKEKDALIQKHKELLKNVEVPNVLKREVYDKFVNPVKSEIKDTSDLIQLIVKDGVIKDDVPLDQLFELVVRNGKMQLDAAARRLNAHPARVGEWAKMLKKKGLIDIVESDGKIELVKKN